MREQRPVRIAMIVAKMQGGGVESIVMSYLRNITNSDIDFTLFVEEKSTMLPIAELNSLGIKIVYIPSYSHVLKYHLCLYKAFKKNKYDIAHAHINTLCVFPLFAAWRAKVPVRIAHNHSTAGKGETLKNIMKYLLRPFAKVFPTHLCACSEYAGKWLYGSALFKTMPNSIDFGYAKYLFNNAKRETARERFNIKDCFVIGLVGRFLPQKNHTFALDIFFEVKKRCPNSALLLVGVGELMEKMKEKTAAMGIADSVIFAGQQADVQAMYSAMDVLIMPSLYEGYPLVAQEAQISGLTVVGSDRITKEADTYSGQFIFLPLEASPSIWAETILQYRANGDRDMTDKLAAVGYDAAKTAKELAEWYISLVK